MPDLTPIPDPPSERKARGAFFTPNALTELIARWVVRNSADRVLEPSCGEAAFLLSIGERLRARGGQPDAHQLTGVELHAESARAAREILSSAGFDAEVSVGDFFQVKPHQKFDVVAGNPPYVRYQGFTGESRRRSQDAASEQGVRLSGLASSWAAFVIHSSAFLKDDGRLGLVLPAELLSVNYAAPVREFLLDRFADVRLVVFEERVFPNVSEEVVLLLAEGKGPSATVHVHNLRDGSELADPKLLTNSHPFTPNPPSQKWTGALLPAEAAEALELVGQRSEMTQLRSWGDPNLGIVTGNNKFFTLSTAEAAELGIPRAELLPISPPGSKHLRGLSFTAGHWTRMKDDGHPVYLFYPDPTNLSTGAKRLIRQGEAEGVHEAYKCRVRDPWWRVPLVTQADLLVTYMNHDAPRLVANGAGVLHLNSVHGMLLKSGHRSVGKRLLPIAMLNSLTLLAVETVGRSYGGGILKVEPREAAILPAPTPQLLKKMGSEVAPLRRAVASLLANKDLDGAAALVDYALLTKGLGVRGEQLDALRQGRKALFGRRSARSGK